MTAATLSAPESKAGRLQGACLQLLRQHEREGTIPTNGRFLFYELEQQGVVPKHYVKPSGEKRERKVLYIGDCEERGPGDQIEANTRRYIEEHAGRIFTPETWIKVALTPEQVARSPRLRRLAIDKVDHRCKPPRPYKAVECEAVGQAVLERMLRAVLDGLLPEPLDRVRLREERQRRATLAALTKLGRRR
jgi:hypothetical protein